MRRLSLCLLCGLALLLLPAPSAQAQTASLVRDIGREGSPGSLEFGAPEAVARVQGKVFFVPRGGSGMWVSDGTAQGTLLLSDVSSNLQILGSLNGVLLWTERNELGSQLWRSDGTRAGTYALSEAPLALHYEDSQQVPSASLAGSVLYFVTALPNQALWRSDGTRAGTRLLRSFAAGLEVEDLRADAGRAYLSVHSGGSWSIWTSDGTAAGTREARSIGSFQPQRLLALAEHLFFFAESDGFELWASDGTAAGTLAVTHLSPFNPFGDRQSSLDEHLLSASGRRVFFVADDVVHGQELWVSDGTPAGTRRITDFGTAEPRITFYADLGGRAVFLANDQLGHSGLWTTDGAPGSTQYLPYPCAGCQIDFAAQVGSRLVFRVQDSLGWKVLSTDGTPAGTLLLSDSCADCNADFAQNTPAATDVLYFARRSREIWRTDGTPAGTRLVGALPPEGHIDLYSFFIAPGPLPMVFASYRGVPALWSLAPGGARLVTAASPDGPGSSVSNLAALRGRLAFTVCTEEETFQLWQSAGMEASTFPVVSLQRPDLSSCSYISDRPVSTGSFLFYLMYDPADSTLALHATDGTLGGTLQLTAGLSVLPPLVLHGGRVFFRALEPGDRIALWSSDGTPTGTVELAFWPRSETGIGSLTSAGADLYFFVAHNSGGQEIWKSDGTVLGTRPVISLPTDFSLPSAFTRVGTNVFFVKNRLWKTDGTTGGTAPLGAVSGMSQDPDPTDLLAFQGKLYFFAATTTPDHRGLWRTDGTAAGTVLLGDFLAGNSPPTAPANLLVAAGKLFFAMNDGVHGNELWTSDGTAAGTRLVRDIRPGALSGRPVQLTPAAGRLYFVAGDETHGTELWQSDGTQAGTRLVQDIAPLSLSSSPEQLTEAGDRLYFAADDGLAGRELWSLPLTGPGGCQPSPAHLCLSGGRYQVEAAWRIADLFTTLREGRGTAVALTGDTGYFWFFEPTNVEAIVKVLDGRTSNDHTWVFYGALSDVQYTITVTDTQTGLTRRYANPQGQLASVGDTQGFGPLGAYSANPAPPTAIAAPSLLPLVSERKGRAAAPPCQPGPRRLCLNDARFTVEVAWKDFQNHTGKGTTVPLTGDTGAFWFFDAANIELVVKVLDGRPFNGKFWLFYGALSNVEYTLTVTDTQTGTIRTYTNPSGRFASVADTSAF